MVFYMHEAFSVKKQNGILLFRKIRCISIRHAGILKRILRSWWIDLLPLNQRMVI